MSLSLAQIGLAIWCGVPSLINVLMMLQLHDRNYLKFREHGREIAANLCGLVIFGHIINVWTTSSILSCFGFGQLSLARDVNMNLCYRRIMNTRKISFLTMKLERLLCDAHWFKIREGTELLHPYWKISRNRKDEDESFRFAVCNHCNLEFSVPPTYKEYQEMSG
ncbi:hypothetical protein HHI36_008065 [Cryptolaemus montrouzieri]|uniref:Uncharacterized protein n=1 Tax=Cryptolaemus montrouzieri TaxID=559131 RepID=A0ABD2MRG0_9CUCU